MFFINRPVTARSPVTGFFISVIAITMFLPGLLSAADLIDKTKPASIPSEIIDAWKEQDKVSGSNYTTAINNIIENLRRWIKMNMLSLLNPSYQKR